MIDPYVPLEVFKKTLADNKKVDHYLNLKVASNRKVSNLFLSTDNTNASNVTVIDSTDTTFIQDSYTIQIYEISIQEAYLDLLKIQEGIRNLKIQDGRTDDKVIV